MLYTLLDKKIDEEIRADPQARVNRGDAVWETLRSARLWRDQNEPRLGVFAVLADWDADTLPSNSLEYRTLCGTFKVIQVEEVVPEWVKEMGGRIAQNAWDENLLDDGYINPDYATPEQELVYYGKHKDEVMFKLRCLISLVVFEELELRRLHSTERDEDGRQDGSSGDTTIRRDP